MQTEKKMKNIKRIICMGVAIMILAGLTGCIGGVEARIKLAQELLEDKYGESFTVSEYGSQEIGSGYYTARAYAREYPEIPFTVNVDNDGKNFSDNYVARRVCARIAEQVSLNLDGMQGHYHVYVEPMVNGHGLDQPDMSISDFVQHNPANRFKICIFYAPENDAAMNVSGIYENLSRTLTGLEILSGGTIELYLTGEEKLSEIQQYCEATDTVTSEHIELARECKVVSVPFTSGILNMTQQQFEEECGRLGAD